VGEVSFVLLKVLTIKITKTIFFFFRLGSRLDPQPALILAIQLASMDKPRCIEYPTISIECIKSQFYSTEANSDSNNAFLESLFHSMPPFSAYDQSYYQLDYQPTSITLELAHPEYCKLFQQWQVLGNSFLKTIIPTKEDDNGHVDILDMDQINQFYQRMQQKETISESLEILLDTIFLNINNKNKDNVMPWCRSIMAVFQWILHCREINHEYYVLRQKLIKLVSNLTNPCRHNGSFNDIARKSMLTMITHLDTHRMILCVEECQDHLTQHFHTGPYKLGLKDNVVMSLKCLDLFYQANTRMNKLGSEEFYNENVCQKLNIKKEYRIWQRVLQYGEGYHPASIIRQEQLDMQRKSRLFMSSSTAFNRKKESEYQLSFFSYPFLLPPLMKRKIILVDAMSQMSMEYQDACVNHTLVVHAQKLLSEAPYMLKQLETKLSSVTCPYLLLEIRREHFIHDTLAQMSHKWADIKKPLKVKFVEGGEEGMDQGGVQKEFFGVLFEKLVSDELGLFQQDASTRLCWMRPVVKPDTRIYEMVGVLMGLSIYNGVIINMQFPKILWKVMVLPNEAIIDILAKRHQLFTLNDLEEGWPELGHGLRQLLGWNVEKDGDVQDIFVLDYAISYHVFGQGVVTKPLSDSEGANGENDDIVPVTNENRDAFVKDYCLYYMYTAQKDALLALRRGIWSVIGSNALHLCTADELEMVACGLRQGPDSVALNMAELESIAEYDDGYHAEHPTIR
jgi:hypothetical protein